ncbi:MAG: aspartate--tRNA ligase [Eubacteriales bacterium]|nr:aspartate--tRNA ligase [Eubacteriales bacterium]
MNETMGSWKRSCYCTQVSKEQVGQEVILMGWAHRRRDLGSLIFVFLRDRSGLIQLVFDEEDDPALFEKAGRIRNEYVLAVKGKVRARAEKDINPALETGTIEILATELKILNTSETPPFPVESETVSDALRLKYRYLDLRRPIMQRALLMKNQVTRTAREYFEANGFLDIETPILMKSTPEGARDYVVPSRVHPGNFYALPQSPQIYKQLLMVSGVDRYYQIAKCFRDEDLRANRQPEFQQIDMEMSFASQEDIMAIHEGFIQKLFHEVIGCEVALPLKRLTYQQAMERYGSDKPDTRFGMEIMDIAPAVKDCELKVFQDAIAQNGRVCAINAKGCAKTFSRKELDALGEIVKTYRAKGMIWFLLEEGGVRSSISKFLTSEVTAAITAQAGMETGDALFIVAGEAATTYTALGALRLELAERLKLIPEGKHELLWVVDFPMFEYDEEAKRCVAMHHPFTCPREEDLEFLESDPLRVCAQAYDMVCDGYEIGGGSIRIADQELQDRILKALGFTPERAQASFGFLLDALKLGAPPHGGMAYGLDRLVMVLGGYDNIRDVIAFPKVQSAADLMSGAPGLLEQSQLDELHLSVTQLEE